MRVMYTSSAGIRRNVRYSIPPPYCKTPRLSNSSRNREKSLRDRLQSYSSFQILKCTALYSRNPRAAPLPRLFLHCLRRRTLSSETPWSSALPLSHVASCTLRLARAVRASKQTSRGTGENVRVVFRLMYFRTNLERFPLRAYKTILRVRYLVEEFSFPSPSYRLIINR